MNAYEQWYGALDSDQRAHIDKQFRAVANGVSENKRSGSFTLKVSLVPNGNKCTVKHEVKTTIPQPASESRMMWHGKDGELLEEDPKQQKLALHSVPKVTRISNTQESAQ